MYNEDLKTIYCDMDGVLADFNIEPNGLERFKTEIGFFKNLAPIEENINAIKILQDNGHRVILLSASPNIQGDRDKLDWININAPFIEEVILCRNGDVKADFVTEQMYNAVLFDDYGKNCREWRDNGGIAFKVKNNKEIYQYAIDKD